MGLPLALQRTKNGCTRLAVANDKVYQLLAHGRNFSPASSTTTTGRHDIAEILLKVALNTINVIKSIFASYTCHFVFLPKLPEKRSCMLPKYDKTRVDTNFIHLVLILTDFYRTEGVFTSNVTLFNEFQIH